MRFILTLILVLVSTDKCLSESEKHTIPDSFSNHREKIRYTDRAIKKSDKISGVVVNRCVELVNSGQCVKVNDRSGFYSIVTMEDK